MVLIRLNVNMFLSQGQILLDEAVVLEAAVEAKNGRLYVLDGVLTPPSIVPVLPNRCDITESKIVKVSFNSSRQSELSVLSSSRSDAQHSSHSFIIIKVTIKIIFCRLSHTSSY